MDHIRIHQTEYQTASPRRGFTLVELLVVVGIMIALTVMTISMVNVTQDEDRVREGAAQVRSFLEGARDRAIHAKEPRGVRFVLDPKQDPNDPDTVRNLLYIGPPDNYAVGRISIGGPDGTDPTLITLLEGADWLNLLNRGLIPQQGAVLRITDQNLFFTMEVVTNQTTNAREFRLTKDYKGTPSLPVEYSLQLNPSVLPNQEPRQLPRDVVIDLDNSQLPVSWGSARNHVQNIDVLFSPHGTVTGLVASAGVIHLVVAEGVDVFQGRGPGNYAKEGNERIVTVRTQTGGISVHHVDPTGAGATNPPNDPFKYAASGETAK